MNAHVFLIVIFVIVHLNLQLFIYVLCFAHFQIYVYAFYMFHIISIQYVYTHTKIKRLGLEHVDSYASKTTSSAPSFFVMFQAVLFHEGNLLSTLGMFRINTKQTLKNAPIVYNSSSLFWRQIDTPRLYYRYHEFLFSRPMI